MTAEKQVQSYEFKAEIQQLLDILIHSVYTSKDIFIRELISNATDALEKVRFAQARGAEVHSPDQELEIRIETSEPGDASGDEEKPEKETKSDGPKILVIEDTGVGMDEEEVRTNIGTIAHSGAAAFLERLKQESEGEGDLNLIGRFGIGFYSVFMVAKKVILTTRSAQPEADTVVWTSEGLGTYTIETAGDERPRGTRIEIHLKEEESRFATAATVKDAIRKYSNFVPFPIRVSNEQVNRITAVWREQPSQVSDEQYKDFFQFLTYEGQEPLLKLHLTVDAPLQFSTLLFVPETNPEIMGFGEGKVSVQLYVKRVLIDGDNEDLLPKYFRFVKGVVESEDLPLNVSRETLQENAIIAKIRDILTRKLFGLLADLAEKDDEKYCKFWKSFGRILKEGHSDFAHRESLHELLRFNSSRHSDAEGLTGLKEYVANAPEKQAAIYYLSGPSRDALEKDPRLEIFRKRGVEVLYLYELADEFVLGGIDTYKEKKLISADQVNPDDLKEMGDSGADEEGKKDGDKEARDDDEKAPAADLGPLIGRFKEILGDKVTDVRPSERLVDSPACLVGDDGQVSGHLDKMMRILNKNAELPKRVLELNPDHAMVKSLCRLAASDPNDAFLGQACEQLFEGCMLVDGYLTDPHELVGRMNAVLEEAARMKAGEDQVGED